MDASKLAALWRESAGPEPELPKPLIWPFCRANGWDSGPEGLFGADQMRAAMTPSPEVLARFAQAVAEECAKVICETPFDKHSALTYQGQLAAAIRRHVKG